MSSGEHAAVAPATLRPCDVPAAIREAYRLGAERALEKLREKVADGTHNHNPWSLVKALEEEIAGEEAAADDTPTLLSAGAAPEMACVAGDDPNDGMEPSVGDLEDLTWPNGRGGV